MNGMQIGVSLWVAFFAVWAIWALRTKTTRIQESISSRLPYSVLGAAAFYTMFGGDASLVWLDSHTSSANLWAEIPGLAITAAGLGFAIWARAHLGGNWSAVVTVKVGHQLVRTGPYRWVRHPIYSGMILAMLGTALDRRQWRGLAAVVLLYASFKIKSRVEERAMAGEFGAEYDEYSRSTGSIFPKLRT